MASELSAKGDVAVGVSWWLKARDTAEAYVLMTPLKESTSASLG